MTVRRGAGIAKTSRPRPVWIAIVLLYALLTLGSDGQILGWLLADSARAGTLGAAFVHEDAGAPGTTIVRDLAPGSALAAAGVRDGDRLRFDYPWDDLLMPVSGARFGFVNLTQETAVGSAQHRTVVAAEAPRPSALDTFYQSLTPIANIVSMLVGLLIVWRSRGDAKTMCLGSAFVLIGPTPPFFWPLPDWQAPFWDIPIMLGIALLPWLFVRFAMGYYARHTGRVRRWETVAFWLLVAVQFATAAVEVVDTLWALRLPGMSVVRPFTFYMNVAACLVPAWYLARGWLLSGPAFRSRYAMMLMALPICLFSQATYTLAVAAHGVQIDLSSPLIVAAAFSLTVGALLFAYAVLRHKVLDLGFALNRALVYGVVSAVLLGAFGLVEWAVDHFVPIRGREKNALVDAAIALAVFLAFHRVRDAVEHGVEALFFRRWRENETALRRFTGDAGFITRPSALRAGFAAELMRFCAAPCALYERDARGSYRRADGAETLPAHIDPDDPALVALRARNTAVEIDDTTSTLDVALALPMAHRHDLEGFALIGRKPDDDRYRPDEIEALTAAARQVGLDLHALEIERLQQESEDLKHANATLAAQLQVAKDLAH